MDAQGDFIEKLVTAKKRQGDFCVGWEFLNFTDQKQIESKFTLYKTGQLGLEELFKEFFPSRSIEHEVYAPLFQMAKKYQGTVLGTNAPRLWKRVIINEGFSTLSQDRIPRLMQRGSDNYYERFLEAMGGHADLSVIEKYFMAQSYTDATMAQSLIDLSNAQVKIMITGHFHSDFGHGLPSYLEKGTNKNIELIRFVDFKNIPEEERDSILKEHPKYGQRAAYFLIINKNAQ